MKPQAYHDGYETGKKMGGDLRVLERAIADCRYNHKTGEITAIRKLLSTDPEDAGGV